jgi:hypothetical protein
MAAMGAGQDRISLLENDMDKIKKALQDIVKTLEDVVKPLKIPELRDFNPILTKIKAGSCITVKEFQTLESYCDAKQFGASDSTQSHILTAFQQMAKSCLTKELWKSNKKAVMQLDVWTALSHLSKISKLKSDQAVGTYFAKDFVNSLTK